MKKRSNCVLKFRENLSDPLFIYTNFSQQYILNFVIDVRQEFSLRKSIISIVISISLD